MSCRRTKTATAVYGFFFLSEMLVLLLAFIALYAVIRTPRPYAPTLSLAMCDFPELGAVFIVLGSFAFAMVCVLIVIKAMFSIRHRWAMTKQRSIN